MTSPLTISRIEREASIPSLKTVEKISKALLTFLKMSHHILKSIFEQIEKNYQPKR
ncbi:hypothetical protein BMS3Bbin05_01156 [bacterium BMS3Bbin05]|nr:hypothetical protein BMS3Bbin05_01156 [bacterium BMS3Bbin05]